MLGQSRKEALSRTVRLLTKQGIAVTFRGSTPFVAADTVTGKVVRLNLPEIPDDAPPMLIDALQGYVDHECGHIFYTDWSKLPDRRSDPESGVFANIFEDIRLEKLLPRDLPGTKDNLERMYANWVPLIVQPSLDRALATGDIRTITSALLMPMMRALGDQPFFVELMDSKGYWQFVEPLMRRLPGFAAEVSAMETYDDVLACTARLKLAMTPPPPPPAPPAPPEPEAEPDQDETGDGSECDKETPEPSDDADDQGAESDGAESEDDTDGEDDTGGEDGENDDGEDPGDEEGGEVSDDEGQPGDKDAGDRETESDDTDEDDDGGGEDEGDGDEASEEDGEDDTSTGKRNVTIVEALSKLDPTLRRALFLHKKRMMTNAQIAQAMNVTETDVEAMLRDARRGLATIMGS